MNLRIRATVFALVASMFVPLTVVASGQPARAVTSAPEPAHYVTATVIGTPVDGAGNVIGPTKTIIPESQLHLCSGDTCTSSNSEATLTAAYATGGVPQASGGFSIEVILSDRNTVLGSLLYRWHQKVTWTWGFGVIGSIKVQKWLSDKAPLVAGQGTSSRGNATYYYTWCCGLGYSGHYSRRTQTVAQCWTACVYSADPWIWVRVHGNGTYSYDWGID